MYKNKDMCSFEYKYIVCEQNKIKNIYLRSKIRSNTKEVRSKDCPQVTLASRRNDKV